MRFYDMMCFQYSDIRPILMILQREYGSSVIHKICNKVRRVGLDLLPAYGMYSPHPINFTHRLTLFHIVIFMI